MRFSVFLAAMGLFTLPAAAQTIELGSDQQVVGAVQRGGYDSVRITQRQLTIIRTEACKGDRKYLVKVSILGKITSETEIGACDLRPVRTERPRDRQRPRAIAPAQLQTILRDQGYRRIDIIDDRLPRYVAQACRDGQRFELTMNRRGRIARSEPIGTCREPIDPATMPQIMEQAGYDRVRVLRNDRAPYLAQGCRENRLIRVQVNRFGDITDRERIGRCEPPLTAKVLADKLAAEGYTRVDVQPANRGFTAKACRDAQRITLNIDARGSVRGEKRSGACESRTVLDTLRMLEGRGAYDIAPLVQGCFKGDLWRWNFDRLGNYVDNEKIGSC